MYFLNLSDRRLKRGYAGWSNRLPYETDQSFTGCDWDGNFAGLTPYSARGRGPVAPLKTKAGINNNRLSPFLFPNPDSYYASGDIKINPVYLFLLFYYYYFLKGGHFHLILFYPSSCACAKND